MSQAALAVRAVESPSAPWDESVLRDLCALPYVRGVVFTNGKGRVVHASYKEELAPDLARIADLAMAALAQTGAALDVGALEVSACIYEDGVVMLSRGSAVRFAVVAEAGANLGALLNHVRRLTHHKAP